MKLRLTISLLAGLGALLSPLQAGSFQDDFDRAPGSDIGPGWVKTHGEWFLTEEATVQPDPDVPPSDKTLAYTEVTLDTYPFVVRSEMMGMNSGRWAGVAFHVQPDNVGNYYSLIARVEGSNPSAVQFRRYESGTGTVLHTWFPPAELTLGEFFRYTVIGWEPGLFELRVERIDPDLGEVSEVLLSETVIDSAYEGGWPALHANSNSVQFDNFLVRSQILATELAEVDLRAAVEVGYRGEPGRVYQFQRSPDLIDWEDIDLSFLVRQEEPEWRSFLFGTAQTDREFYRVLAEQ